MPAAVWSPPYHVIFFFFNDTATTEIYTLSLHDALPISAICWTPCMQPTARGWPRRRLADRKSTRLNSSHVRISYAVFCLKKKKQIRAHPRSALSGSGENLDNAGHGIGNVQADHGSADEC